MRSLNVTCSAASAATTRWRSRMSWKGRVFDSPSDLTVAEIRRRVLWGIVGLLAETSLGVCQHPSLSQGGRHLSIPSSPRALRRSRVPFGSDLNGTRLRRNPLLPSDLRLRL